jgi:aspartate 1-decarboxylase
MMTCNKKSPKDDIIIISYATLEFEEAKRSSPGLFFQMKTTTL